LIGIHVVIVNPHLDQELILQLWDKVEKTLEINLYSDFGWKGNGVKTKQLSFRQILWWLLVSICFRRYISEDWDNMMGMMIDDWGGCAWLMGDVVWTTLIFNSWFHTLVV